MLRANMPTDAVSTAVTPSIGRMAFLLERSASSRFRFRSDLANFDADGLFRGVELVDNREAKIPFKPTRNIAAKVKAAAFDLGLLCYPMAGTRDGKNGDHVLLAPPFILKESHIDLIVGTLSKAIDLAVFALELEPRNYPQIQTLRRSKQVMPGTHTA